jgi:preprotein translocase subunit YajC
MVDYLVAWLPLIISLAVMVFLIRKTGAFQQREHRQRVEQLLERIANAMEKDSQR